MISISEREATEILISVLSISLALSIATQGLGVLLDISTLIPSVSFFLITVGIGFIAHEMAHKFVAIHFGAAAEFRMWTQGLIFMFFVSLLGFVFAAPGAVYIYANHISKRENGIISLAGPIVNVIIALAFLSLFFTGLFTSPLSISVFIWGARINLFLALFNVIPIYPLDGSKVIAWNFWIWLAFGLITGALFLFMGGF
ncbi:site-2 protease family protein [Candidatus Micrarchaeota archaeon]|nr:site-2 protease family protein [Candidatus Micrarchaeota archaeon]